MATLRTPETEAKYAADKAAGGLDGACIICGREALQDFAYWKIVTNAFPYDKIAKTHHMLATKEHITWAEISPEAWAELEQIKKSAINSNYHLILENTPKAMTIPAHFHMHLIIIKE